MPYHIVQKNRFVGGAIHHRMFKVDPHTGSLTPVKAVRNIMGQYHYQQVAPSPFRRLSQPPYLSLKARDSENREASRPTVKYDVANELSNAFGGMLMNRRR
jgi:hypothetical protein